MNSKPEEGNPASQPEHAPHGHCGCGDDAEQKALHEVEEAEAKIAKGRDEVQHGLHDIEDGEHYLEKAKADFEEARHHPHVIHFTVDGEPVETQQREWKPNDIIKKFGERDPATNYLVRIKGHHQESFKGKGDIPIKSTTATTFRSSRPAPRRCPTAAS